MSPGHADHLALNVPVFPSVAPPYENIRGSNGFVIFICKASKASQRIQQPPSLFLLDCPIYKTKILDSFKK